MCTRNVNAKPGQVVEISYRGVVVLRVAIEAAKTHQADLVVLLDHVDPSGGWDMSGSARKKIDTIADC